jgi:hypothetical protein
VSKPNPGSQSRRLSCWGAVVVGGAFACFVAVRVHRLSDELAAESDREGRLRAQLAALHAASDLQRVAAVPPVEIDSGNAGRTRSTASDNEQERLRIEVADRAKARAAHAELQPILAEETRLTARLDFGALYTDLGLDRDAIARFEDILAEHAVARRDLYGAADELGVSTGDPAFAALDDSIWTEQNTAIAELLGQEGLRKFEAFERESPQRSLVSQLAGLTYYSEHPLTLEDGQALMKVMMSHGSPQTSGRPDNRMMGTDWDGVFQDAGAILSPGQMEVWSLITARVRLSNLLVSGPGE